MIAYHYHPLTGEALGSEPCMPDPLEPGRWLVPAQATLCVPPAAAAGQVPVWSGAWALIEDHRGATIYDCATRAARTVTDLGPIPADTTTLPPPTQEGCLARWADGAWALDPIPPAAPEPPAPLTEASAKAAIQQRMDAHAQSWGYDSALSAASYAASTVPRFAAEAAAVIAWRDATWATGYVVMAEVQAGTRTITTIADLLALLPAPPERPSA